MYTLLPSGQDTPWPSPTFVLDSSTYSTVWESLREDPNGVGADTTDHIHATSPLLPNTAFTETNRIALGVIGAPPLTGAYGFGPLAEAIIWARVDIDSSMIGLPYFTSLRLTDYSGVATLASFTGNVTPGAAGVGGPFVFTLIPSGIPYAGDLSNNLQLEWTVATDAFAGSYRTIIISSIRVNIDIFAIPLTCGTNHSPAFLFLSDIFS